MRVSVIVPAFNASPYIERCLESLASQQPRVEIILVNDGSTDDTLDVVRRWLLAGAHEVRCVDQPNRGLSAARNAGLAVAAGEFIGFVDGDDWVAPEMFQVLVGAADRTGADLVIGGAEMVDHLTGASIPFQDEARFSALAAAHTAAVDPQAIAPIFSLDTCACKRLYRRALFTRTGFSFAEGLLFEDVLAHYHLLLHTRRVSLVDAKLYRYRVNHPGRITDRTDASILTVFEILSRTQELLREQAVSAAVWANYVWFQNWVLRWLATRIQGVHREEYLNAVVATGRCCPRTGLAEFQRQFAVDQLAQWTVALQMAGLKQVFYKLATDTLSDDDRRTVARVMRLAPLLPWLGRMA